MPRNVLFTELHSVLLFVCLQGSKNIYTKEGIIEEFLKDGKDSAKNGERIVFFHCEFSSERGPKL